MTLAPGGRSVTGSPQSPLHRLPGAPLLTKTTMTTENFQSFVAWVAEKPATRSVKIEINRTGQDAWAYDTELQQGCFCQDASEIDLHALAVKELERNISQLRKFLGEPQTTTCVCQ